MSLARIRCGSSSSALCNQRGISFEVHSRHDAVAHVNGRSLRFLVYPQLM